MTLTNRVNHYQSKELKTRHSLFHSPAAPSFPTVRNERNKGSRLWFEIPRSSVLE
ncbi:hypothetical protein VCHA37P192_40180 [Vibrio chagasii]|nr:hypothetical protein VCHA37P192_40180 [Vibrio chagasii]